MTRFHGIKCLPALLLGLMHKLALPHPPPPPTSSPLLGGEVTCHADMPQVLPGLMAAD